MKSFKRNLFLKYSVFLSIILGLLGVQTSCGHAEYGAPTATYKISGNMKSDSTGNVIQGIKISMFDKTVYSDANGNYYIEAVDAAAENLIDIRCFDMDDTLHGKFQDKDTLVDFSNATYTNGDGHWFQGETSKTVNIKLKPQH